MCKNIRFDKKLLTDARDCLQIFSCAYMTYTLLANVQSQIISYPDLPRPRCKTE